MRIKILWINYSSLGVTVKLYPRRIFEISLRIYVCCRDNWTSLQVVDARFTETTNCKPTRTETVAITLNERLFGEWMTTTGVVIAADTTAKLSSAAAFCYLTSAADRPTGITARTATVIIDYTGGRVTGYWLRVIHIGNYRSLCTVLCEFHIHNLLAFAQQVQMSRQRLSVPAILYSDVEIL